MIRNRPVKLDDTARLQPNPAWLTCNYVDMIAKVRRENCNETGKLLLLHVEANGLTDEASFVPDKRFWLLTNQMPFYDIRRGADVAGRPIKDAILYHAKVGIVVGISCNMQQLQEIWEPYCLPYMMVQGIHLVGPGNPCELSNDIAKIERIPGSNYYGVKYP